MRKYYVYALLDPRKRGTFIYDVCADTTLSYEPFYIGKGSGDRATFHLYPSALKKDTNKLKSAKINAIWEKGLQVGVVHLAEFETDTEALNYEREVVSAIGTLLNRTGPLTNIATGGGGSGSGEAHPNFGVKWPAEVRKKMSDTTKAMVTEEQREFMRQLGKRKRTPEENARMSERLKGHKKTPEHCKAISEAKKTKMSNPQTRIECCRNGAILTEQEVKEILELVVSGVFTRKECAEIYGTLRNNLDPIFSGKRWVHLQPYLEALKERYRR